MTRTKARRAACPTAKVGYPTEAAAQAAALRVSLTIGCGLRAYGCPSCGRFHLTRQPNLTWGR